MHIKLWLSFTAEAMSALVRDRVVREAVDLARPGYVAVEAEGVFDRIVALTKETKGYLIAVEVTFSAAELETVGYFEVVCRKTLPECNDDYAVNSDQFRKTTPIGPRPSIRLLQRISLRQIDLAPTSLAALGEWTNEYVVGSGVVDAFKASDLNAWELRPILNTKTKREYEHHFQLVCAQILPHALVDETTQEMRSPHPEEVGRRALGCLAYGGAQLTGAADFNRSAEPWASLLGIPAWIVSRKTVACVRRARLRGWGFRPVLVGESDLYREYLAAWGGLMAKVRVNPANIFTGGR